MPASYLVKVGRRHVLVVDRFDRTASGDRVGYVSAMTMLAARDGDQRSYLEIAEVIEERSDAVTAELEQLWRRMAFSVLASNTDDHLRNHGFLHARGDVWNLAPAFDLNPIPQSGTKYLATAIDETETEASIDLLLGVADYFRLHPSQALGVLGRVTAAVTGWREVATRHGLDAREMTRMEPAFEHPETDHARELTGYPAAAR